MEDKMNDTRSNDIYKLILKDKSIFDGDILNNDEPPKGYLNTGIIGLNCAMSGKINGGIPLGHITMFAAHSTLGKTIIGMAAIRDAQIKGIYCVVLDAEFQWDWSLAEKMGIVKDQTKITVIQNNQIEEIQAKIIKIVSNVEKPDRHKIFFMFDSWGSLVTYEGVKKASDPDAKKDMNLTLKKNNLANMILSTRATFYICNGVYDNVGGFGDPLKIPGAKRIYLNSHVVVLGKSKAKEEMTIKGEDVLTGAIVSCKIHKSRLSREQKEFKFRIKYNGGLDIFYGILEDAMEGGYVKCSENGFYTRAHIKDDKKFREKEIYCSAFWLPIFNNTDFKEKLEESYQLNGAFDVSNTDFYSSLSTVKEEDKPVSTNTIAESSQTE
jgi:RecA/RadA recombinase